MPRAFLLGDQLDPQRPGGHLGVSRQGRFEFAALAKGRGKRCDVLHKASARAITRHRANQFQITRGCLCNNSSGAGPVVHRQSIIPKNRDGIQNHQQAATGRCWGDVQGALDFVPRPKNHKFIFGGVLGSKRHRAFHAERQRGTARRVLPGVASPEQRRECGSGNSQMKESQHVSPRARSCSMAATAS